MEKLKPLINSIVQSLLLTINLLVCELIDHPARELAENFSFTHTNFSKFHSISLPNICNKRRTAYPMKPFGKSPYRKAAIEIKSNR